MKKRSLLHFVLGTLMTCCAGIGRAQIATEKLPRFEKVATINRFVTDAPFRAVAIRHPWVYILSEKGILYIFQLSKGPTGYVDDQATKIVKDVGDGKDLKIVDQALLCTRNGHLEVYSLKSPDNPRHLGRYGPADTKAYRSQSMVLDSNRAFLVGRDAILAYDMSIVVEPRCVSVLRTGHHGNTGCVSGRYLYVGGTDPEHDGRGGIVVYDVADPRNIQEVAFTPTRNFPYHLFALSGNRLLASESAASLFHFGTSIHGNSSLFSLAKPTQPVLLKELAESGGRTATLLSAKNQHFLVCNGAVFVVGAEDVKKCSSFPCGGPCFDPPPYHGDSNGLYAALATDYDVFVVRMRGDAH